MKNRIFVYLLALATLALGMSSCVREELSGNGAPTEVTVSVSLPDGIVVKSDENPGDGTVANRCILEIYEEGELYGERMYADIDAMGADFTIRLITGRTYSFVFWADYAEGNAGEGFEDAYYNTSAGLTDITVNADAYVNNSDRLDAFYGSFSQKIEAGVELNFNLTRPFGQINIYTLDLASIPSNVNLADVVARVSFEQVPAGFNALDGSISSERISLTPASFAVPVNFPAPGEAPAAEAQISFDYLFASPEEGETLVNFTLELEENGKELCSDYEAYGIPMRQNYRTNVKNNFITKGVDISVSIDPIFNEEGDEPGPDPEAPIEATIAEFLDAEVSNDVWYQLRGVITNIANTTYGNINIEDKTGEVYIYGLTATKQENGNDKSFAELGLQVNDTLTLVTLRGEHNGEPQGGGSDYPAYYISHVRPEQPEIPEGDPTALIISEYSEGTSYNKFIEITNVSEGEIDLAAYLLRIYTNGAEDNYTEAQLEGTLAAGASKVYTREDADLSLLPEGIDVETISKQVINFNGNDPMAIICNGEIADIFGTLGSNEDFAKDVTFRRASSVTAPSNTYKPEEWEQFDMTDLSGFGSHTFGQEPLEPITFVASAAGGNYYGTINGTEYYNYNVVFSDGSGTTYTFDIYGDAPATSGMTVTLPNGTYSLSTSADQQYTFYSEKSFITDEEGASENFTEGTLTIDPWQTIGELKIGEQEYILIFYSEIKLENQGPVEAPVGFENDVNIDSPKAYLTYNSVKGSLYSFRIELNGFNTGGYNAYLDLIAQLDANGHIMPGTYNAGENAEAFTLMIGENRSFCNYTDENYMQTNAMITGGYATVSESGIEVNVTVEGGSTVTSTYSGSIDYDAMLSNSPRFPSAGSNTGGNVDLSYNEATNAYGNIYSDCWHITIAPTYIFEGPALYLDLITGKASEEGIGGTYSCSDSGEAGTFLPGTAYVNGSDFDNWGTVYYYCRNASHSGTYATISDGTITVTQHSFEVINEWGDKEVVCDIELNGIDPEGNTIHVVYENLTILVYDNSTSAFYSNF